MDSQYYGICVLYIKNINGINRGRIVHLPYLGNNETLWESVIEKCITFFKKEKCCIVTALAHNSINQLGYIKSGFIRIKKHRKPLFIKDTNQKLSSFHVDNWFLQFSEGDKAYRDL
jgi:hypothetical protein